MKTSAETTRLQRLCLMEDKRRAERVHDIMAKVQKEKKVNVEIEGEEIIGE